MVCSTPVCTKCAVATAGGSHGESGECLAAICGAAPCAYECLQYASDAAVVIKKSKRLQVQALATAHLASLQRKKQEEEEEEDEGEEEEEEEEEEEKGGQGEGEVVGVGGTHDSNGGRGAAAKPKGRQFKWSVRGRADMLVQAGKASRTPCTVKCPTELRTMYDTCCPPGFPVVVAVYDLGLFQHGPGYEAVWTQATVPPRLRVAQAILMAPLGLLSLRLLLCRAPANLLCSG